MEHIQILPSIVILIATAVFVVITFTKFKISPVLGYLVAGTLIGDHGFKIVTHNQTNALGELGVVFLLFAIGLELSFERLRAMQRYVLGLGSLQVILTALSIGGILILLGRSFQEALIVGCGLSLSSTAVVLQVLSETGNQKNQVGRISLAILLQQDFAVVPLLVIIPLLASESDISLTHHLLFAFFKAAIALVVIFIAGRLLLRPIFRVISSGSSHSSRELFVAATLLIVLTAAWGTEHMGLSLALGAFVAGILVAETEFRLQAEESIAPFKGLLLGLFFMSVGMDIDVMEIFQNLQKILIISISLVTIKSIIIILLSMLFGFSKGISSYAGLMLSQGGEFAFILFDIGIGNNVIDKELGRVLLLVVTCTMAITPLLAAIGQKLLNYLDKNTEQSPLKIIEHGTQDVNQHVIVGGLGKVGKMVARVLEAQDINYIAIDINEEVVKQGQDQGIPVFFGDISNIETLKAARAEKSLATILAIDNKISIKKSVKNLSDEFNDLTIIVRSDDLSDANELYELGASIILPVDYEIGLQLGSEVLKAIGVNNYEITRIKDQFRTGNYIRALKHEKYNEYEEID